MKKIIYAIALLFLINPALFANELLTAQVLENGVVLVFKNSMQVISIEPQVFTQGWKYSPFQVQAKDSRFNAFAFPAPDGQVGLSSSASVEGHTLKVHYHLIPLKDVKVISVRAMVYLNYKEWIGAPYQIGRAAGKVPVEVQKGYLIAQGDSQPVSLGPSEPQGLSVLVHDEGLFSGLEDDRNWGTYLGLSINHYEPITPWVWKAGEAKDLDFSLDLNREFTSPPTQAEAPSQDPTGYWYGSCDFLGFKYRMGLYIHRDEDGKLLVNDYEVDGETTAHEIQKVTWSKGDLTIHSLSSIEGPVVEKLHLDPTGRTLSGTIVVSGENPFMEKGKPYSLKFSRGLNYLVPRVDGEGKAVTQYTYQIPQTLTDGWPVGDLGKSSLDPGIVVRGMNEILNQKFPRVQSLVVIQHGRLLLDEYFQGYGPQDIHQLQSSSKSIFSVLFGIAHDQGLVDPEQKLYDFYPEYRGKPNWTADKDLITLGSLLSMSSGYACDDWVPATDCHKEMWKTTDWLDFVLNQPMNHKPGEFWAYCNDCLEPLGDILARKSVMSVPDFAQKYLFGPLGLQDPHWIRYSPNGTTEIAGSILMRPRDMAKVGELVLQKGIWNGQRIVSEKWLKDSTQYPSPITKEGGWYDGYGYLWWRKHMALKDGNTQVVFSAGKGGQLVFTVPDLDLVCVMTGGNYDDYRAETMEIGFFQAYILGAVK